MQSLRYQSAEELLQVFNNYRKINFINKIRLTIQSRQRLKKYRVLQAKREKNRKKVLKEIAIDLQERDRECLGETVELPTSNADISTEDG